MADLVLRAIEQKFCGDIAVEYDGLSAHHRVRVKWWQGGTEEFTIKAEGAISIPLMEECIRRRDARITEVADRPGTYAWRSSDVKEPA
jgi:hypothetical protein